MSTGTPRADNLDRGKGQTEGAKMECPQCKGQNTIQIEIRLKEEDSVQFFSCRRCEAKWWEHAGDTIALDEVLTLASHKDR
ncbi:MAG: hypothetical protein M3345_04540 [Actinomycetota bacterium]|nr:hypothetical protein [Actinomycetota bacterium]